MKCDVCGELYTVQANDEVTTRLACSCEKSHRCSFQKRGSVCDAVAQVIISPYDAKEILEWRCYKHAIEELLGESVKYRELIEKFDPENESLLGLWVEELMFLGDRKQIRIDLAWFKRKVRCVECDKHHVLNKRRLMGSGKCWWTICPGCTSCAFVYQE